MLTKSIPLDSEVSLSDLISAEIRRPALQRDSALPETVHAIRNCHRLPDILFHEASAKEEASGEVGEVA